MQMYIHTFIHTHIHTYTHTHTHTLFLAPLQSVLNTAARWIARIPRFSHTFMTEQLHWHPLSAGIHFKIIFLVYKAFLGLAPSYLCKVIMRPLSAISDRPLRSLVRNDLLVP